MLKPIMMGELQAQTLRPFFSDAVELPATKGGPALSNLVRARLDRGLPTDIIMLDPEAIQPIQRFRSEQVNLWVVRRRPNRCIRDGYRRERMLIAEALAESEADVCHAHWTYEYGLTAVLQDIKPYVVTVRDHSLNILRWVGRPYLGQYFITQYVLRRASGHLTAVSPYIAEYVSRISGKDVPVVPNIVPALKEVSHKKHKEIQEKSMPFIILTLADSGRLKNVKRAIRAFQQFRQARKDVRYLLVGSGLGANGSVAQWARSKGFSEGVEFLGWMPHSEVLQLVRSASLVLHPSLEESFGNPVAEAMAMGIPVVGTTEAGGVRWLLNNECGWLVRGKSVQDIASTLSEVVTNPALCRHRCASAVQRINQLCDPTDVLERYGQVYEKALGID